MDYLRTATFGGLFGVTFVVAATFQILLSLIGAVVAVLSPGIFFMSGTPSTNPGQALGVLLFMLGLGLAMNAGVSAAGAGIWILVRRFVLTRRTSRA